MLQKVVLFAPLWNASLVVATCKGRRSATKLPPKPAPNFKSDLVTYRNKNWKREVKTGSNPFPISEDVDIVDHEQKRGVTQENETENTVLQGFVENENDSARDDSPFGGVWWK